MLLSPSAKGLFVALLLGPAVIGGCSPGSPAQPDVPHPQLSPPGASKAPQAASAPQAAAPPAAPIRVPVATFPERPHALFESTGEKYMVVSQGEATTKAARKMLEMGGNVI